jgi:hypothetical protein
MGNTKSINIEEKSNGIFKINVLDFPSYPIAYIRLCWDSENSKYCMAQDCEVLRKFVCKRKFMVVGMRIPELNKENIYEQVFYLSSGLNSIDTLNKFFKTKFILKNETENIWIPFSGFGYDYNDLSVLEDLNINIKLIKNNFGHGCSGSLYGRFGNYNPNLMQISYCLGGDFWENNIDNSVFKKYNIIRYPTIEYFLKQISCFYTDDKYSNNVDCSVYLNNYIGSALSINYSPELLKSKMSAAKTYTRFSPITELSYYDDIQFDYRIMDILYQHKYYLFQKKGVDSKLPFENTFNLLWNNYFDGISKLYKNNRSFFDITIIPILNSIKQDTIYNILNEKNTKEEVFKEEKNDLLLKGTFDNPYKLRKEAKNVGDYYYIGEKLVQKKK